MLAAAWQTHSVEKAQKNSEKKVYRVQLYITVCLRGLTRLCFSLAPCTVHIFMIKQRASKSNVSEEGAAERRTQTLHK